MARIINFNLAGVAQEVQFGLHGAKLSSTGGNEFAFENADRSAFAPVKVGAPSLANHAVTKQYVDDLDKTQIVDAAGRTKVDTDQVAGKVVVSADNGSSSKIVATFQSGANADSNVFVDNSYSGKVLFNAYSQTATDVNIHLAPQGAGEVMVGSAGTAGAIQAEDGMNLTVAGGDSATVGGDLILRAGNGATDGQVKVTDGSDITIVAFASTASATSQFNFANGISSAAISTSGAETDIDLVLDPKGSGAVNVSSSLVSNVLDPVSNQDAATKFYTDTSIETSKVGSIQTREITISTATNDIGLPIKGVVRRVMVRIDTAYETGAQITVGTAASPSLLVDSSSIDETTVGIYDLNVSVEFAMSTQLRAFVTGGPAFGAATLIVEYVQE